MSLVSIIPKIFSIHLSRINYCPQPGLAENVNRLSNSCKFIKPKNYNQRCTFLKSDYSLNKFLSNLTLIPQSVLSNRCILKCELKNLRISRFCFHCDQTAVVCSMREHSSLYSLSIHLYRVTHSG